MPRTPDFSFASLSFFRFCFSSSSLFFRATSLLDRATCFSVCSWFLHCHALNMICATAPWSIVDRRVAADGYFNFVTISSCCTCILPNSSYIVCTHWLNYRLLITLIAIVRCYRYIFSHSDSHSITLSIPLYSLSLFCGNALASFSSTCACFLTFSFCAFTCDFYVVVEEQPEVCEKQRKRKSFLS